MHHAHPGLIPATKAENRLILSRSISAHPITKIPYRGSTPHGTRSWMRVLPPRTRLPTLCTPLVAWSRPVTRVAHTRHHCRPHGQCKTAIISLALLKRKACSTHHIIVVVAPFVRSTPCSLSLRSNRCPYPTSPTSGSSNDPREGSLSFGANVSAHSP